MTYKCDLGLQKHLEKPVQHRSMDSRAWLWCNMCTKHLIILLTIRGVWWKLWTTSCCNSTKNQVEGGHWNFFFVKSSLYAPCYISVAIITLWNQVRYILWHCTWFHPSFQTPPKVRLRPKKSISAKATCDGAPHIISQVPYWPWAWR